METLNCLANRYFLVVDDEEFVRSLVGRFLRQSGAAGVVEALDGKQAIAAVESYEMAFDAVISDINMRPMNGLELLGAIRTGAGGLKRNTPVLMLTAHAEADLVAEPLALDADAFLVKPVARETLIERTLRVLERIVPIQATAHYAGISGADGAATALPASLRHRAELPGGAVSMAQHVSLEDVRANSILAQDIRFGEAQKLLLAAPVILTQALLDRLKDLRLIHNSYTHLWVVEPRPQEDLPSGGGPASESTLTPLHAVDTRPVSEQMVGDLFLAPALTNAKTSGLVEQIRAQIDEVAERAQTQVDRERVESAAE